MKRVAILAYEGCWAMGVFSATDFFRVVSLLETHLGLKQSYSVAIVSLETAGAVGASGHLIRPDRAINRTDTYDLVVIPAIEGPRLAEASAPDSRIVEWLARQIQEGASLLALTTGASLLAATGLVDDILLATHWAYVRQLSKRYPACRFVAHKSFLRTDGIYSTGSLNGCFDALLEILAQERGDQFSQLCATHLLVSDPYKLNPILPGHRNHADEAILKAQDWIESHYAEAITIDWMARSIGLSERTLKRRFQNATRLSPIVYLQKVRIDKAKKLLLATSLSVKEVAYEVGYENVSYFVRLFKGGVGQTPAQWRKLTVPHEREFQDK
jgi:transcriptional regulator GlxA family with amidase domain